MKVMLSAMIMIFLSACTSSGIKGNYSTKDFDSGAERKFEIRFYDTLLSRTKAKGDSAVGTCCYTMYKVYVNGFEAHEFSVTSGRKNRTFGSLYEAQSRHATLVVKGRKNIWSSWEVIEKSVVEIDEGTPLMLELNIIEYNFDKQTKGMWSWGFYYAGIRSI